MNKHNMKTTDEDVIIATNRDLRKPLLSYMVVGLCVVVGYAIFREIGSIVGVFAGILLNIILRTFRCGSLSKLCKRDFLYLISKGYSERDALIIISKSFKAELSKAFHEKVIEKFSTLDEVVGFYTGALPFGTIDEKWAVECLEKTTIERQPSGGYKVRTKH